MIMKKLILMVLACVVSVCGAAGAENKQVDNTPVETLDMNRYLGSWYEIARFDHWFERGLEQTKALYTLREDGMIRVENTGIKNGETKQSIGKAKTTDQPALLRISFFGPFYGDYRILLIDKDYQYALVGGSSDAYLWIFSRTPKLEEETLAVILAEAQRRGYDTSKLIWVKH